MRTAIHTPATGRWNYHTLVQVVVTSFGYRHGPSPRADLTLDVRGALHDPNVDPAFREMTGLDQAVRDRVLRTPGAVELAAQTAAVAVALVQAGGSSRHLVRVAVGCAGGRHRSVVLAGWIADHLEAAGVGVEVEHQHIDWPVLAADETASMTR